MCARFAGTVGRTGQAINTAVRGGVQGMANLGRQTLNIASNVGTRIAQTVDNGLQAVKNVVRGGEEAPRFTATGGRNTTPLSQAQIDDAVNYARELGFDGPIDYRQLKLGYNTSYSDWQWLLISDDVLPAAASASANGRLSWKAAIAHEIVGHHQANIMGKAFRPGSLIDEVQASVRAARNASGLTDTDRYLLLRDAAERIRSFNNTHGTSIRWSQLRDKVWLGGI